MTTAGSTKRPYAERLPMEERREQLLDAALAITNSRGVDAVSIDAVAKRCGVTRPVVYRHFTDAEHLLRVLLDREAGRAFAQLGALVPTPVSGSDPIVWFTGATQRFLEAVLERPETWRAILLPVGGVPGPVRDHILQAEVAMRARVAAVTRIFLADRVGGEDVDVELLALVLVRFVQDAGRLVLERPDEYPPERISRFAASTMDVLLAAYPPKGA